ncbi:MAG TPA: DegT/DnrJ/EryC1/StrS family aminotransferase [Thermoleophilia bacterium]|nr:DegT/DnrJ/EryC1/StrS family aminotransferase [Thermoleophilia bacterium]
MATGVPFVDLRGEARELHETLTEIFGSVLSRAAYVMGPECADFEAAFASFCGSDFCAGVSSGTDAVRLALQGVGVAPGDEVIVPVNTFMATAEAVGHAGATPVFVDCLPDTANIDAAAIEAAITPRTKAIVPVHLYGQPADMDPILELAARRGLAVIEDACQAHGALYRGRPCGSMGVTAAFSFYPGKNLGALGDGGAVVTSDPVAYRAVRLLRNHGEETKSLHEVVGYCNRLDNLQAGFLLAKLGRLPAANDRRRRAAASYDQMLRSVAGVTPIAVRDDVEAVYHLYVVQVDDRDAVRERLGAHGVQSGIHYPLPLHLQPAYRGLGYARGDFPRAEELSSHILSLPMFPAITDGQIESVVELLDAATC